MANKKKILLIIPSNLLTRGLESVFDNLGEFEVAACLTDFSRSSEARLRNMDIDAVIIDPVVFDAASRPGGRNLVSEQTSAAVIAFQSSLLDEEMLRTYDERIGLYDEATAIIRKIRTALDLHQEAPKTEGEELSAREKEILICVAKGMLNKEIADLYNLSVYTVITHRKNITRKTGIKTVAGLTVYALLNNLLDINSVE